MATAKKPVAAHTVVLDSGFGPTVPDGNLYVRGTAEKGGSIWAAFKDKPAVVLAVSILTLAANQGQVGTATFGGAGYQVDENGNVIPGSSAALTFKFVDQKVSVSGLISGEEINIVDMAHNSVGNPVRYI